MVVNLATLACLTLFVSLGVYGVMLIRQGGARRIVGVLLLVQAILLLAAQIALSTIPFGFEPLIRVPLADMLTQTLSAIAVIALSAVLVVFGGRWLTRRLARAPRRGLAVSGLLLAVPFVAGGGLYGLTRISVPERERERDPNKRQIELPSGFGWSVYAQGTMDNPTVITFADDGTLYIGDIGGTLWKAQDTNNDLSIDLITPWARDFRLLVGLAWHGDELFVSSSGKIEALRDGDGDGTADQRRVVVDGLPSMILMPHSNNSITFGDDDRLYFGVGSTTDGQIENDPLAASILSVKPDGSDLKVFARGLGNSFDLAFNSQGALFAGDNAPSGDGPDEFNHIIEGEHYGFPYFYGDPPENGGTRGALATFPSHSAPTGTTFYSGANYPEQYRDSAFVTLWASGEVAHVEVAETTNGDYLSRTSMFGSGFLYPIDAITGPDGNLYIADFGTSAVYRITYDVNKDL